MHQEKTELRIRIYLTVDFQITRKKLKAEIFAISAFFSGKIKKPVYKYGPMIFNIANEIFSPL